MKRRWRLPGGIGNLHNNSEDIPGGTKTGIMRNREIYFLPQETGYVVFFR